MQDPWFIRSQTRPDARLRLFCFPYAGVGASTYRTWPAGLPADVDLCAVQPPGRETRLRERPFEDMEALVEALAERIRPYLDLPYAFFGHSMGACVAFELARGLARGGAPPASCLLVSGRRAPRLPNPEPPIHRLPDDDFIAEIRRRYGGIPEQVVRHPDLLALLLPGLRADLTALERYVHEVGEPLACPLLALGGTTDPCVSVSELEAWRAETTGAFLLRLLPGGHFYLQDARSQLLEIVTAALRTVAAPTFTGSAHEQICAT